jgi:CRISPR-associated protein Csh2
MVSKSNLKVNRSQLMFLYTSVNNNPNGDPFTGQPRQDEATEKPLVSDVRIKRYIRDYLLLLNAAGLGDFEIYLKKVDRGELDKILKKDKSKDITGSAAQIGILAQKYSITDSAELMKKCLDVQCFGGVATAEDNNSQITGPMQFRLLNPALNRSRAETLQNTSIFQSKMENRQGSIGTTSIIPFSINQVIGEINPFLAVYTGLEESQVMEVLDAMWKAVNTCISRSKMGQDSRLLIKLNMKDPSDHVADLDEKISIKETDDINLRSISQVTWDFSKLAATIASDKVASVQYRVEDALKETFESQLAGVKKKLTAF